MIPDTLRYLPGLIVLPHRQKTLHPADCAVTGELSLCCCWLLLEEAQHFIPQAHIEADLVGYDGLIGQVTVFIKALGWTCEKLVVEALDGQPLPLPPGPRFRLQRFSPLLLCPYMLDPFGVIGFGNLGYLRLILRPTLEHIFIHEIIHFVMEEDQRGTRAGFYEGKCPEEI